MKQMEAIEELCLDFSSFDKKHHEDLRCEFDAPRYYDFSRPETCFEAQQAERWFDFAATYPPSPFIAKLKFGKYDGIHRSSGNEKLMSNDQEHVCLETDSRTESVASTSYNKDGAGTIKAGKEKLHAAAARSSSTLMKPTASYLAKQRRRDINLNRLLLIRHRKSHTKDEKINSTRSSVSHIAARSQKLEAASHKVAPASNGIRHNYKVTLPREPVLETSRRAQGRRSNNSSTDESVVTKSRACLKHHGRHLSCKVGS